MFYIDGVGWIPASMIEEGDVVVLQSGDKSAVEKIDKVVHNELITVYNFEVEDFHTYFVSDASVLVHNDYSGVRRKKAGNNRPTSKTTWQRGKTERVDVENFGNGKGNVHYHEPDNTKWYYNLKKNTFTDFDGNPAPSRIQKLLKKDKNITKGLSKAYKYLEK